MIKDKDLHSYSCVLPLKIDKVRFGTALLRYEVRQYNDVRNLENNRSYIVECHLRVIIPNEKTYELSPLNANGYLNYPAMLSVSAELEASESVNSVLLDYHPRTLNTAITSSLNGSQNKDTSSSQQYAQGSSVSQTNSYSVGVSAGTFGGDPMGSVTATTSHSDTHSSSTENTSGRSLGLDTGNSQAESMSIKDWGAYCVLNKDNSLPVWVWGQEYPWDIIQFRYCPKNQDVQLPKFVQDRLLENGIVHPPSQLALFGIDFTMRSSWLVHQPKEPQADFSVNFQHRLEYLTASHSSNDGENIVAALAPSTLEFNLSSPKLDLSLYALDPIQSPASDNGAVVGFVANKFTVVPQDEKVFQIVSGSNNLHISGTGFDRPMVTSFNNGSAKLKIQFKLVDELYDYTLFLKHWKTTLAGCMLNFVINGDEDNAIVVHVDAQESEGGEKNLTSINLRNQQYSSVDYHDYLQVGLNQIEIEIQPDPKSINPTKPCGYQLRAVAIGGS